MTTAALAVQGPTRGSGLRPQLAGRLPPAVEGVAAAPNAFNTPGAIDSPALRDLVERFRGAIPGDGSEGNDYAGRPNAQRRSLTASDVAANYGIDTSPISVNPNDPEEALGALTRRDVARYDRLVVPAQQELVDSLQDTSIVEEAREVTEANPERSRQRAERNRRRYGLRSSGAVAAQAERQRELSQALDNDAIINDARIEQKTRNDGLRRTLIDIGRGVATNAQAGLGAAADSQAQREALNDQLSAQRKAQRRQTNTAIGTTILSAVLMAAI